MVIGLLVLEAATLIANGKTDQSVGADLPRATMQAVAGCAIWIPCMLSSRRVKNTFDR